MENRNEARNEARNEVAGRERRSEVRQTEVLARKAMKKPWEAMEIGRLKR
jgi:hypothetical protein